MQSARRPWGFWLVLLSRKHFKVKLLYFKKGGSISLQRHKHRNELWLFLSGNGHLHYHTPPQAGDYALMKQFTWHKYTAEKPTWVLEIQYGTKCEEKDIERHI